MHDLDRGLLLHDLSMQGLHRRTAAALDAASRAPARCRRGRRRRGPAATAALASSRNSSRVMSCAFSRASAAFRAAISARSATSCSACFAICCARSSAFSFSDCNACPHHSLVGSCSLAGSDPLLCHVFASTPVSAECTHADIAHSLARALALWPAQTRYFVMYSNDCSNTLTARMRKSLNRRSLLSGQL